MEPGNWASEHSDALRDYFFKGMSFAEIGKEINARFGTNYSRNAVIGRAKRMGLAASEQMPAPPIAPHLPNGLVPQRWPNPSGKSEASEPPLVPAEPIKLRCVGIWPRLVPLLALEPGDCRYPYGGDRDGEPIAFCGHPRRPGSSYCTPHFHLTSGPDTAHTTGPVILRLVAAA